MGGGGGVGVGGGGGVGVGGGGDVIGEEGGGRREGGSGVEWSGVRQGA